MKPFLFKSILSLTLCFVTSCALVPPEQHRVNFEVISDPPGCPVEIDGIYQGTTPMNIWLGTAKVWVGLSNSSDGWGYSQNSYTVRCLPPPGGSASQTLTSQTKFINPAMTPEGGKLYFDLKLAPVPTQTIEIK